MANKYFVSGIGTDVGKTIASAILCEALQADYWKPVQAGELDNSDSIRVKSLVTNKKTAFHPERFKLNQPMSPHAAAKIDGIRISPRDFTIPQTSNSLIVEGAGGLMVPLNEHYLIIDLIEDLGIPVILVSRNYLGSINHTLLSIEILKQRDIALAGIIFNDLANPETESIIETYAGVDIIGRIEPEVSWNRTTIATYAHKFKSAF